MADKAQIGRARKARPLGVEERELSRYLRTPYNSVQATIRTELRGCRCFKILVFSKAAAVALIAQIGGSPSSGNG
jgi:hypothetical protein